MSRKKKLSNADFDAQFDAFLKASVSSDESSLDTARVSKYLQNNRKPDKKQQEQQPWWMNGDDDSISDRAVGLSGTGRNFLKKKPDPAEVKHTDNNLHKQVTMPTMTTGGFEVDMSRDSLDDTSLRGRESTDFKPNGPSVPALALDSSTSFTETTGEKTHPGLDTLQELKEKEEFFQNLQKQSGDSTIDYSRLNRDLDKSATLQGTLSSEMGKGDLNQYSKYEEDYEEDEEDEEEDGPSNINGDAQEGEGKKPSMLSKVALMDSLDSTLGTKYASQETRPDDMKPIIELTEREEDECDGSHQKTHVGMSQITDSRTMDKSNSEHTAKGITLKTGTGFGFTDTSHEIEALQAALRQAGMSTLGTTRDFTLHGSSSVFNGTAAIPVADSHVTTGTADVAAHSSPAFGLNAMVPNSAGATDSRTVDDIIKEVDELRKTGEEDTRPNVHFENDTDAQGFDLSPVHTINGVNEEQDGTDYSPLDKYADSHPLEGYENSSSPGPIPAPRLARKVPTTKKKTKEKFPNVSSSGYGKLASPPRKSASKSDINKNKKAWTPSGIYKPRNEENEMLHTAAAKARGKDKVDKKLVASVQSFAKYIQTHFTESQDLAVSNNNLMPDVKFSQDGPSLSSSQKIPVLERERALVKEVKEWQDMWREEQRLHAKFKAEFENAQRDYERKLDAARLEHEEQVFKLKQENFVLSAKVAEDESSDVKHNTVGDSETGSGTVSKEQLAMLEKEVQEQEGLLAGYQAENERLYQELKKMQKLTKTTEQQMFKENQRLQAEVANLKQQLEQKETALRHQGLITSTAVQQQIAAGNIPTAALGAGRIATLEAQLKQVKAREEKQQAEMQAVAQAKTEVEHQVEHLSAQLTQMGEKVKSTKQSQSQEAKEMEARYKEEVEKLTRRLKWYAENQELLDRDHQLLKEKEDQIKMLNDKIQNLNSEHGRRQAEAKARVKERASDARKITDLQRQVREMETIIRKRHPNSLPVLMWAANAAIDSKDDEQSKPLSVRYLEDQCKKLEHKLESKDEEAKKSLRVMEQKYTNMKYQYEDRIKTLELTLKKYEHPGEGDHPHSHAVALQKELDSVRDRYKKQVTTLEADLDRLKKEISSMKAREHSASKAELRAVQDAEHELQAQVRRLEGQLLSKEKERASVQLMLERAQKEKQQLSTELARHNDKPPTTGRPGSGSSDRGRKPRSLSRTRMVGGKKSASDSSRQGRSMSRESVLTTESEPLPPYPSSHNAVHDKHYIPDSFTGLHIEDVLREREELKHEVERLKLATEHYRIDNQKLVAEAEDRERRASEHSDEALAALRMSHQIEIQKLLTEHAMVHSTSRVAELQGRLETQEIMVKHLKEQLSESHIESEQLATLRLQKTTLESQITDLLSELQEARQNHTPEMHHFVALQEQIRKLESRHQQREQELKQLVRQAQSSATADLNTEIDKWRKVVEGKNREIEKFRSELDTILQVLQELQRQGVVLPGPTSTNGSYHSSSSRYSDS